MEVFKELTEKDIFKNWKEEHQNAFLSHFFCPLNSKLEKNSSWEIAFYDPDKDKVVVFVDEKTKKEDEVFKKEGDTVEELNLDEVKVSFEESSAIFKENLNILFPSTIIGDGFVVLQTIKGKTFWNFTFINKALQFINIKINSVNGKIESHQTVELINKN